MEKVDIPEEELDEQFVRSSGPGGQHVNKVSSAVQLRWRLEGSEVPERIVRKFRKMWANRITASDEIVIEVSSHRSQLRNRQEARKRLREMLEEAARPEKKRVPTRPGKSAVQKRLKKKKIKADIKAKRGRVKFDGD